MKAASRCIALMSNVYRWTLYGSCQARASRVVQWAFEWAPVGGGAYWGQAAVAWAGGLGGGEAVENPLVRPRGSQAARCITVEGSPPAVILSQSALVQAGLRDSAEVNPLSAHNQAHNPADNQAHNQAHNPADNQAHNQAHPQPGR
eukprot:1176195-Prorocentrum_minimum.AAC.1